MEQSRDVCTVYTQRLHDVISYARNEQRLKERRKNAQKNYTKATTTMIVTFHIWATFAGGKNNQVFRTRDEIGAIPSSLIQSMNAFFIVSILFSLSLSFSFHSLVAIPFYSIWCDCFQFDYSSPNNWFDFVCFCDWTNMNAMTSARHICNIALHCLECGKYWAALLQSQLYKMYDVHT